MATLSVVTHRTTPNIYETPSERKGLRQVRGENCINFLLNTQVNYYPINNVWNIWLKIIMSKFVHFISSFVTYQLLIFISLVLTHLKLFALVSMYHSIVNFENFGYKNTGSCLFTFCLWKEKKSSICHPEQWTYYQFPYWSTSSWLPLRLNTSE